MIARHRDPDHPDDASRYVPAHLVDHGRTIATIAASGCTHILSISSVGSLRTDLPVGSVVVPDDFYAPQVNPTSFADVRGHRVPGFDADFRNLVARTWHAHDQDRTGGPPMVDGGVYAQTTGPRFETPAEVRALARVADVVGMTVAAECILAGEAGLAYAAVCVVDNLGNGLDPAGALTLDEYERGKAANRNRLVRVVTGVIADLTEVNGER